MADNILKKQLDCISEDFLREVFGRVSKPMWRALVNEARLRFISGRPPKVRQKDPLQMEFAL